MDDVERREELSIGEHVERVGLHELLADIPTLPRTVDADDVEPGELVAARASAFTAVHVEEATHVHRWNT